MSGLSTLEDLDLGRLQGTALLVRVDFNVPLAAGRVTDTTRLEEALPTLRELSGAGARLLLASHLGRPGGEPDPDLSLRPVAASLAGLLGRPVLFAPDCIGEPARSAAGQLGPGGLCLLENLRFHPGEEGNDGAFAAELAALGEGYVGDAFGSAHRAHASVVGVPGRLERKAAGRLLVREVEALSRLLEEPERPFVAVLGGAKVGGKLDTLANLLPRLDRVFLGGGMANTFLAARGCDLRDSLVEEDRLELARKLLEGAGGEGAEIVLPEDLVVSDSLEEPARIETVRPDAVPQGMVAVDLGEASRDAISRGAAAARTLFWNGPVGVFEKEPFDAGTLAVAAAVASCPGFTVIGGGETVAAARRAGVAHRIGHVSTGGGASLEFLAGKTLPGIAALERRR